MACRLFILSKQFFLVHLYFSFSLFFTHNINTPFIWLFTGRVGLGLCSTHIHPNLVGWSSQPIVDREIGQIGQIRPLVGIGQVGQSQSSKKKARNEQENGEISLDLKKISLDILDILPEFGFFRWDLEIFRRNLDIFRWKFLVC